MANHASAEKKFRRDEKRRLMNSARMSRIRTFVKKAETSFQKGTPDIAAVAFRDAQSELMRGVSKGLFHRNVASRKIARFALKLKGCSGVAA